MTQTITPEDYVAIANLIGEYQWRVDDGADTWVEFWTEDGVFDGGANQRFEGKSALLAVPRWVSDGWNGKLRHQTGSLYIAHVADADHAVARYYSFVSDWSGAAPRMFTMVLSTMQLVRQPEGWKIRHLDARQLVAPRDLGTTS